MEKGIFFLIVGVAMVLYLLFFHNKRYKKCTSRTLGSIIECLKTADNEHGDAAMDYYIVEYEIAGKTYTNETGCEIAKARAVGDKLELFYDPNDPANCYFAIDVNSKRFLEIILWIFSVLMFTTSAYCFMK